VFAKATDDERDFVLGDLGVFALGPEALRVELLERLSRQLEPALVGRRIEHAEIRDSRLVRPYEPAEVAAELGLGERVADLGLARQAVEDAPWGLSCAKLRSVCRQGDPSRSGFLV